MEMIKTIKAEDLEHVLKGLVSDRILLLTGERPEKVGLEDRLFLDDFSMNSVVNDVENAFGRDLSSVYERIQDLETIGDFYNALVDEMPVWQEPKTITRKNRTCASIEKQNG